MWLICFAAEILKFLIQLLQKCATSNFYVEICLEKKFDFRFRFALYEQFWQKLHFLFRKSSNFIESRFISWNLLINISKTFIPVNFCENDRDWLKHLIWDFMEIDKTLKKKFENGICFFQVVTERVGIKHKNKFHVFNFWKYSIVEISIRKYSVDTKRIQLARIIDYIQCILANFERCLESIGNLSLGLHFQAYFCITKFIGFQSIMNLFSLIQVSF